MFTYIIRICKKDMYITKCSEALFVIKTLAYRVPPFCRCMQERLSSCQEADGHASRSLACPWNFSRSVVSWVLS